MQASKKEIMHAAFAAVIAVPESDADVAKVLQDVAIKSRAPWFEGDFFCEGDRGAKAVSHTNVTTSQPHVR